MNLPACNISLKASAKLEGWPFIVSLRFAQFSHTKMGGLGKLLQKIQDLISKTKTTQRCNPKTEDGVPKTKIVKDIPKDERCSPKMKDVKDKCVVLLMKLAKLHRNSIT